jgi:hypothetical protein
VPERLSSLSRVIWAVAIATIVLFLLAVAIGVAGFIANSHRISDDRSQRHNLCAQIEGIKDAERTLWTRAIDRSIQGHQISAARQRAIDAFKDDLHLFFPKKPCNQKEAP